MPSSNFPARFRRPLRASHLRRVDNNGPSVPDVKDAALSGSESRPLTPSGSVRTVISPGGNAERALTLWVHDDGGSTKEDAVLDLTLFPKGSVKHGDLVEIVAFKPNRPFRDYPDATKGAAKDGSGRTHAAVNPEETRRPISMGGKRSRSVIHVGDDNGGTADGNQELDLQKRFVFVVKDVFDSEQKAKYPNLQVCISSQIANAFGFKNRMPVMVSVVDPSAHTASHVEITFRDEYLTRADMWRLAISELSNKAVYKGKKIVFMGTIKASIKNVYVKGRKVRSAYFSTKTIPVFRSESARYTLFIQMSKEMWDFDSEGSGEIMFNKIINGFLPELFKRWVRINARHLITIVLFTRLEYECSAASGATSSLIEEGDPRATRKGFRKSHRDYYRVVVSDMASGEWTTILDQLKKEFKVFLRDVSIQKVDPEDVTGPVEQESGAAESPESIISGHPSAAIHGNVLEAINLASSQFANDYIDRDLMRTGLSIVIITPGVGLFEVDYNMLKMTTEVLIGNGIGIDLVCLSRMPLHSVPLFKYRSPQVLSAIAPEAPIKSISNSSTPRQKFLYGSMGARTTGISPSKFSELGTSPKQSSNAVPDAGEWCYAIPHWIDVSFWNGASDESQRRFDDRGHSHLSSAQHQERIKPFVPRCRMYELQMMGIMENEMSNILIPYLHEGRIRSSEISTMYPGSHQPGAYNLNTGDGTYVPSSGYTSPTATKQSTTTRYGNTFFGRPERDYQVSKQDKEASRWMDVYDDLVFRSPSQLRAVEKAPRQAVKNEEQRANQRVLDDETLVFENSYSDSGRSPGGVYTPAGTAYLDRKMKERQRNLIRPTDRKTSTMAVSSPAGPRLDRPTKLSRQISFGFRGLGVPVPKATASTGITSAHAKPGPILTRGFNSQPVIPSATSGRQQNTSPVSSEFRASLARDGDNRSEISVSLDQAGKSGGALPSQPIAIKSALKPSEDGQASESKAIVGSLPPKDRRDAEKLDVLQAASMTKQAGPKIDLSSSADAHEAPSTLSPHDALSPWLTILNPSNPKTADTNLTSKFRRWQHVFPRPLRASTIKWKSLCSPAAVPLTTEYFPTAEQLIAEYQESPYKVSQNEEDDFSELPRTRESLIQELVAFRLSHGFQLVFGPVVAEAMGKPSLEMVNVFDNKYLAEDGAMVFMSLGNTIHQLTCVEGDEVELKRFIRKPATAVETSTGASATMMYQPEIQTVLEKKYNPRQILLSPPRDEYNWNYVDSFIAGYEDDFTDHLRFWRARFVLIPVEVPLNARRTVAATSEDTQEEIRLEGIRKLTQMWQRYRYVPPDERRFQGPARLRKDPNPLDIIYQTRDPSAIVAAEIENLPFADGDPNSRQGQLLTDAAPFQRTSLNLSLLAREIQGEKGVKMIDRRWHWKLHYNCFIGADMTTWLLDNFKDVDTREEAVELGNEFMEEGLFQHVDKRHPFRDGNFFYQIGTAYQVTRSESRSGWFGTRRSDKSVPATPISTDSPQTNRSLSSSSSDVSSDDGARTPTGGPKKLKFALSKVMKYDVDPRGKSDRPELVNLHYDRLHNPDSCYHIRIEWMNVTAKLIEDALSTWAVNAEKYGLRMVEVPISEAASINQVHPFRSPYIIHLAAQPPSVQPEDYFDSTSFVPQAQKDPFYYHKAILREHNFVLDLEAAQNFPADVEVSYSWGKPDYRFSQYIHRSGLLLAQITDDGTFLLLANRLYNNRSTNSQKDVAKYERSEHHDWRTSSSSYTGMLPLRGVGGGGAGGGGVAGGVAGALSDGVSDRALSPFASPAMRAIPDASGTGFVVSSNASAYTTAERIKNSVEDFCNDAGALQAFYEDTLSKAALLQPDEPGTPSLEASIPSLRLPPSLALGLGSHEGVSPLSRGVSGSGSGAGAGAAMYTGASLDYSYAE
ncbi:MAG: hypothetical protein M1819_005440 [Sarea resinae]|nr:MAG: hypothetical protein M1819_005440 [Sarea resinae]